MIKGSTPISDHSVTVWSQRYKIDMVDRLMLGLNCTIQLRRQLL